jgi:hypothetical protein
MGFWDLFTKKKKPEKIEVTDTEVEFRQNTVNRLAEIINESLNICEVTKNIEIKKSRVLLAEEKLNELKKLRKEHGDITLGSLTETELLISKYKTESGMNIDRDFDDLIEGFSFHPTLKLKTPLWLLEKDGEIFNGEFDDRPQYGDDSQGFWTPKVSSKFDFLDKGATSASDAGPVFQEEYLVYAKSFRGIVESELPINNKINEINELPKLSLTHKKIHYLLVKYRDGKIELLYDYVFANSKEKIDHYYDVDGYLFLIHGLNKVSIDSLTSSSIKNINQLDNMKDKDILAIKGIGSVSLKKIRASIAGEEI